MPPKLLTQRGLLDDLIDDVAEHLDELQGGKTGLTWPGLRELRVSLQEVLDAAQNPPPQGVADGTIDHFAWDAGKKVLSALTDLEAALLVYPKAHDR